MTIRTLMVAVALSASFCWGLPESAGNPQKEYESSIAATLRNKTFYKANSLELTVLGGLTPYDLVLDHLSAGGRLTWHFSDHYGWEIVDFQYLSSKFTSFTTDLVGNSDKNIQRMDALKVKSIVISSFLLSPIYGKIRFFGSGVIYFDLYASLGLGTANVDTVTLSFANQQGTVSNSSWDPAFSFGFGFKIFLSRAFGLVFDFRDYVVSSTSYDARSLKSNYTVMGGLTLFLPSL